MQELLVQVLQSAGFTTVTADNGYEGVDAVLAHEPIITTVDVTMPGIDGIEVARRIRDKSDTYIIMITALSDEADLVLGLSAGADDFLTKPFRPRELRARIEAMQRRPRRAEESVVAPAEPLRAATADSAPILAGPATTSDALTHRDLTVDLSTRLATVAGVDLDLTRTEFDLLAALLDSGRRVRSKADLALILRGESYVTSSLVSAADRRTIEAHMTNLRRKLDDSPVSPRYIETVRGIGYRLTTASD